MSDVTRYVTGDATVENSDVTDRNATAPYPNAYAYAKGTTVTAVTVARGATRTRKPQYREERRTLMRDVASAVARHHLPAIPEITKQNCLSGCLSLLQGGYSLDLVRSVAIATALEYTEVRGHSQLMQIRVRVRIAQSKIDEAEHLRIKADERDAPISPEVRAALSAAWEGMRAHISQRRTGLR